MCVVSCNSSQTGPHTGPRLVLTGAGQQDTIDALLPTPLTAYVAGSSDARDVVEFTSVPVDSGPLSGEPEVAIALPDGYSYTTSSTDTATPVHHVAVALELGQRAGDARVIVGVPSLQLVDTAHFTVRAGRVADIAIEPRDSVIYLNGSAVIRLGAFDRFGNVTSTAFTMRVDSGPASAGGAGGLIVRANTVTLRFDLINATTGLTLPLPFTTNRFYPAWRPMLASPSGARVRHVVSRTVTARPAAAGSRSGAVRK